MLNQLLALMRHRERTLRAEIARGRRRIEEEQVALQELGTEKSRLLTHWRRVSRTAGPMSSAMLEKHRQVLDDCHQEAAFIDSKRLAHGDAADALEVRLREQTARLRNTLIRAEKLEFLKNSSHEFITRSTQQRSR